MMNSVLNGIRISFKIIGLVLAIAVSGSYFVPLVFLFPLIILIILWCVYCNRNPVSAWIDKYVLVPAMLTVYLFPLLASNYLLVKPWQWLLIYYFIFLLWYGSAQLDAQYNFLKLKQPSTQLPSYLFRSVFLIIVLTIITKAYLSSMPWIRVTVTNLSCRYMHVGCKSLCEDFKSMNSSGSGSVEWINPLCK